MTHLEVLQVAEERRKAHGPDDVCQLLVYLAGALLTWERRWSEVEPHVQRTVDGRWIARPTEPAPSLIDWLGVPAPGTLAPDSCPDCAPQTAEGGADAHVSKPAAPWAPGEHALWLAFPEEIFTIALLNTEQACLQNGDGLLFVAPLSDIIRPADPAQR